MRRAIVFGILLAVIVGACGFYWYSGTPEHSLWQLRRALQRNDMPAVERYIDVDAVSAELVDSYLAATQKRMDRELAGNPYAGFGQGLVAMMAPQLKTMAAEQFRRGLRENAFRQFEPPQPAKVQQPSHVPADGATQTAAASAAKQPAAKPTELRIMHVARDGDAAEVTLGNRDGTPLAPEVPTFRVRLAQQPDRTWRIVSIPTLGEILAHAAAK